MKSKHLLLLLLLAIGLPWAANAQETLTVCDGTATSSYAPIKNGGGSQTEFIYPASLLGAMEGGTITSVKFFSSSTSTTTYSNSVTVFVEEVASSTISASAWQYNQSTATKVYEGTTLSVTGGELVITFSTPYEYNGGNLCFNIWSASNTPSVSYYYLATTNSCGYDYYITPPVSVPYSTGSYLPKAEFTYTAASGTCEKPATLEYSNLTSSSVDLAWTGGSGVYNIELNGTIIEENYEGYTYSLRDLAATTAYTAKVQSVCDGSTPTSGWKSVSFTTPCASYDIPYTYDFEAEAAFACWTPIAGVTRANSSSNAHAGSYYLRFSGTTSNLVALPQFNEATNNLRVEFWTRPEGYTYSSCGTFSVGYMTDITDASSFVEVANYAYNEWTSNTHVKKTVDFTNAPANANIAFRHNAGSTSYYWYADDVTVKEIPSCLAPTDLAATVTAHEAELSWTANSGETAWTVYYKKTTDETYTEVANATNPYTLNGLDAATNYQYYVVANCSAEDASEASEVFNFVTECEAISTYPWTENFDSYTAAVGVLPICWNKINTTTYSSYQGYPRIYNYNYQSSPNCLYFYSYYSTYSDYDPQDQYAILPEMENLNGKQLSLFARGANTNSSFKVGLMTDPTDVSTFVEIATTTPTTGYVEYTYNLTGTGNYIAIMMEAANSTATSRTVYIDDITIAEPPACPKPIDLTVVANSVTPHSVQLSWVSDASAWIVAYKTAEEEEFTEVNATENPFTLTGLTDGMTYTAKVCAVCDGTPGEWTSTTVSFTTPIACPAPTNLACNGITGSQTTLNWTGTSDSYDVLYRTAAYAEGIYENFGTSIPSGWEMYTGLLTNGTATMTSATYGWNFGANNGVFDDHARVNIYGNNQRWLVTKAFTILQDASTLSFDIALTAYTGDEVPAPATTGTDDKFIVLISTDNMSSWITLREWNNSGSEYVYNNIANNATGENVVIDLSAYVGQNVRIAFYGESTESNADNNLHIDNVHCGIPHEAGEWQTAAEGVTGTTCTLTGLNPETDYEAKVLSNCEGETGHETIISFTTEAACMVPTELTVVSVTTTTAVLTWTSSSTAWQIQVNEEEPIDVTAIPYTLEGLTPATTYTFKVRANCDGSYTEWSNAASFTTECEVIAAEGYSENFDSYEVASNYTAPSVRVLPNCWSAINTTTYSSYMQLPSIYYYSSTNYANTTPNCLKFYSYYSSYYEYDPQPQYAILPEMTGLAGMQVTLKARGYDANSTFKIGTMSDPADASTFTMIMEQTGLTTSYQEFEYLIPADCQNSYLAIMIDAATSSRSNNGVYIDDIVISTPPTCLKPTDLEVTATTSTTATFSWTNGAADQTAWQICLNGDETNLIMASSNPFTVEGLTASTNYTAKVRAYCSEEDQSDWSNEVSFATECEAIVVDVANPFTEGFEGDWTPLCWESIPYSGYNWSRNTYQHHDGSASAYSGYYGPIYLVMPDLQLGTDGDAVQLTFWSYNTYVSSYDKNSVVLLDGENEIELWSPESVVDSWEETTIDLTAYMGQTISLAFKYEGDNAHGWYVDDVEVTMMKTFTKHIIGYASDEEGSNGNNYYLIASPLADAVAPTTVGGMITDEYGTDVTPATSTYDLYSFDESEDLEWQNYRAASNFNLVNGQGYLYASKEGTTLTFTGAPYSGDTKEVTLSMTDNENADFQGWNLVGNPFTDLAYIDRPFYRMDATGTRVLAEEQTGAIQVMEGVFVVATEDEEHMAFSTVAPNNNGKGLVLNLSQGRGNTIDRAIVGIGQGHTLPKFMFNPNDTKLYIPQNGKDYAVVRSRVSDEIPVNFLPTEDGYYKISVDVRNMNLRSLVLKDKVRNVSIDLLRTPNYMFKASAYDRADRFVLSFKNGNGIYKEKIVKGANPDDFSFYSNGVFVIDNEGEANLQVIDMNGRVLSSENIYGSTSITVDAAPGIYLLRLTNGDNVKVQKVVVE